MTKDMTTGKIMPMLVQFTVPLVLGNLFQLTYNAVDSIIVGHFVGKEALAAVMIGVINGKIKRVPLAECAGKLKMVSPKDQLVKAAKQIGISFGD